MDIKIVEMKTHNIHDVNQCDNEFIIDSKLILNINQGEIVYSTIHLPLTRKRYGVDIIDYMTYVENPDRVVFLAYKDDQVAGQIILCKNWNNFAYIEDITVDVKFRRLGIGKELILQARRWARNGNLVGIMLETQDNNVAACKFYEKCDFCLRGFDTYLYKGIDRVSDEIALYWYLVFSEVNHPLP